MVLVGDKIRINGIFFYLHYCEKNFKIGVGNTKRNESGRDTAPQGVTYLHFFQFLIYFCGPGSSSGKARHYGLDGPGSIPVSEGGDFSSLVRVQISSAVNKNLCQKKIISIYKTMN